MNLGLSNRKIYLCIPGGIILCGLFLHCYQAQAQKPYTFTSPERGFVSSKPATNWENALVSGNGKYGALVFGKRAFLQCG